MPLTKASVSAFAIVFAGGVLAGRLLPPATALHAQAEHRVFELRRYTAPAGKLGDLEARFRNHTIDIFNKHGITSIGYWVPQDAPDSQNTLIYIVAHPSREAAKKNWAAFQADPEWRQVSADSQANGPIVTKVESTFMEPTDFSSIK